MKEIHALNAQIVATHGHNFFPDGLTFWRDDDGQLAGLLPTAKEAAVRLLAKLNECIPNDFGYTLHLGCASPTFRLSYADGPQTEFWGQCLWSDQESIFEQLATIDWDDHRQEAISNCQIFDRIKEVAEVQPTRHPLTANAQKAYSGAAEQFISRKSQSAGVSALFWHDQMELPEMNYADMEAFTKDLPDLLTCYYRPICVVNNGSHLSAAEIDDLNLTAYNDLRGMPLSQAKASCKFERPFWDV